MITNEERLKRERTRWRRWLGQITKDYNIVRLMNSNYTCWLHNTYRDHGIEEDWRGAINAATMSELGRLDEVVMQEKERQRR